MESEPSWAMLALALVLVLSLTAWTVWLSVTEVKAVKPAPATVRPGRLTPRRGRSTHSDTAGREDSE